MSLIFDLTRPKSYQIPDRATRAVNFIRFKGFCYGIDSLGLGRQKINLVLSL